MREQLSEWIVKNPKKIGYGILLVIMLCAALVEVRRAFPEMSGAVAMVMFWLVALHAFLQLRTRPKFELNKFIGVRSVLALLCLMIAAVSTSAAQRRLNTIIHIDRERNRLQREYQEELEINEVLFDKTLESYRTCIGAASDRLLAAGKLIPSSYSREIEGSDGVAVLVPASYADEIDGVRSEIESCTRSSAKQVQQLKPPDEEYLKLWKCRLQRPDLSGRPKKCRTPDTVDDFFRVLEGEVPAGYDELGSEGKEEKKLSVSYSVVSVIVRRVWYRFPPLFSMDFLAMLTSVFAGIAGALLDGRKDDSERITIGSRILTGVTAGYIVLALLRGGQSVTDLDRIVGGDAGSPWLLFAAAAIAGLFSDLVWDALSTLVTRVKLTVERSKVVPGTVLQDVQDGALTPEPSNNKGVAIASTGESAIAPTGESEAPAPIDEGASSGEGETTCGS